MLSYLGLKEHSFFLCALQCNLNIKCEKALNFSLKVSRSACLPRFSKPPTDRRNKTAHVNLPNTWVRCIRHTGLELGPKFPARLNQLPVKLGSGLRSSLLPVSGLVCICMLSVQASTVKSTEAFTDCAATLQATSQQKCEIQYLSSNMDCECPQIHNRHKSNMHHMHFPQFFRLTASIYLGISKIISKNLLDSQFSWENTIV